MQAHLSSVAGSRAGLFTLLLAAALAGCSSRESTASSTSANADEVIPECIAYEQAYRACVSRAAGSKRREVAEQHGTKTHDSLVMAMNDPSRREELRTRCADGTRRLAAACR